MTDHGGVTRHLGGSEWEGVEAREYRDAPGPGGHAGVTRRLLASSLGAGFEVRYFEVAPGGRTSREAHRHVHVVIVLRGRGSVRIGPDARDVGFGDVVHVAPEEPHQFLNPHAEPFGFVCIVDRDRDRPVAVGE